MTFERPVRENERDAVRVCAEARPLLRHIVRDDEGKSLLAALARRLREHVIRLGGEADEISWSGSLELEWELERELEWELEWERGLGVTIFRASTRNTNFSRKRFQDVGIADEPERAGHLVLLKFRRRAPRRPPVRDRRRGNERDRRSMN